LALLVGCLALLAAALAPSAAPAPTPLSVHQEAAVGALLAPGDRVEISYALDTTSIKSAKGSLYVRNDLLRRFERLPLTRKRYSSSLHAVVPARLIRGHQLLYYAVVRDPRSGRSVTVPAAGALAPKSALILERPVVVRLRAHRFGHPRAPDAIVARAAASEVGWQTEGDPSGPETFLVGRDRSIWLHDEVNHRLLVWRPGRPDAVARSLVLPFLNAEDVALGPAGTLYFDRDVPELRQFFLYRLSLASGKVLWRRRLAGYVGGNTQLRVGPDGTLYALAADLGWMPAATPGGGPLSMAEQRRRAGHEPLAGGLRLLSEVYTPHGKYDHAHEVRFALIGPGGGVVRAWRVVSRTAINLSGFYTPALVGGDPVVVLDATAGADHSFKWEYVVLRLGPGGTRARFSLRHAVYGDNLFADLRVGPDGTLYQLGSSPTTGVVISRYSLGPIREKEWFERMRHS